MKIKFLSLFILFLTFTTVAQTNYYVSTSGNNSNDGSISAPFRNMQNGADIAMPGDSIIVMDGEYFRPWNYDQCSDGEWCQAAVILKDVHGEPTKPIVFKSQNKHGAKISFFGRGGFIGQNCSYIVIDGFEIEGPGESITKEEAVENRLNKTTYRRGWGIQFFNLADGTDSYNHHIEIRNNLIHHTPNAGIRIQDGDYILIEDNIVHNVSWWSSDANGGIVIAAKKQIDDKKIVKIVVRRNKVYNVGNYNIFWIEGDNSNGYGGLNYEKIDDGSGISFTGFIGSDYQMDGYDLIENNICFNNGMNGLTFQGTKNGIIRNNTVYANNAYPGDRIYGGIAVNGGENVKLYNNIAVGDPDEPNLILYNIIGNPTNLQAENNLMFRGTSASSFEDGVIESDPLFAQASRYDSLADFSLTTGSPAIDLGTDFEISIDDYYGNQRPVGAKVDAGAIEYSSDDSHTSANNNKNFWDDSPEEEVSLPPHRGEFSVSQSSPQILINSNGNIEIIQFQENKWALFTVDGKQIISGQKNNTVPLSEMRQGLYLLRIDQKTFRIMKK
jgi:parallel beta-helix repeat protein